MYKLTEIDSLSIKITASTTEAEAAIDRLATKMNSLTTSYGGQGNKANNATQNLNKNLNSTNKTVKRAKTSWGGLASVIGRFYASCFLAIRGVKALGNSIQSTADYFEAFNYFNVALGKIGKDWEDDFAQYGYDSAEAYANSFATRLQEKLQGLSGLQMTEQGTLDTTGLKNLGLNIQEITQYSAQLASVTNSIGQTGKVSIATASAFTKLASDMSSLFNMDYSQVMNNLTSGLLGQSRAMYKYGIDITNATLQTYAYELGIEKAVSEMTQAEKQQLRMIAILDQSKVAWGDQANTIGSLANQMRILENNMQEISLVLGQLFVPLMEQVLPVVNGLARALKELLVSLSSILGIKIDPTKYGQGFMEIEDSAGEQEDAINDATDALKEYKNQLLGFDEVNKLQEPVEETDTQNTISFDIEEDILEAIEKYEIAWQEAFANMDDYSAKWEKFFNKILVPIKEVLSHFKFGYDMDFESFGIDLFGLSTKMTEMFNKALKEVDWGGIGYRFGQFFQGTASESFNNLGNVGSIITNITVGINTFIARAIDSVDWKKLMGDLVTGLTNFFKNLDFIKIGKSLSEIGYALNSMFAELFDYVLENPDEIAILVGTFIRKVFELAISFFSSSVSVLGDLLKKVFGTIIQNGIDKAREALISSNEFGKAIGKIFINGAEAWKSGNFGEWFCETIKTVFGNAWNSFSKWFDTTALGEWWNKFKQNFSMEKFRDTMGSIKEAFTRRWNSLKNWFEGTAVNEWWSKFKENFKAEKWTNALSGIKDGFEAAFNNAISAIKTIWNKFADSLNAKLTFTIEAFKNPFTGQQIWSDINVNLGKIPKFQTGGFPEDGLFFANHNELVGKFSNGRTAVANNEQITQGIEQASYRGMARALAEYQGNGGTVNVVLQGDADNLFRVVQSKADNYTMQTGRPAFII